MIVDGEPQGAWAAAYLPTWETQLYAPRALSDNGNRLFFNSYDALLPRDTNGMQDVYEWERSASAKDCEDLGAELFLASSGGCLSLISSGQSPVDSQFADASPDGRDVFFKTAASLAAPRPRPGRHLRRPRAGGLPTPPTPNPPCEGEACQSPPPAPNDPTPSSTVFEGPGNLTPEKPKKKATCPKGKRQVKQNGKTAASPRRRARPKSRAKPTRAGGRDDEALRKGTDRGGAALRRSGPRFGQGQLRIRKPRSHLHRGPTGMAGGLPPLRDEDHLRRQRRWHPATRRVSQGPEVDLPPGFVANPTAVPRCSNVDFLTLRDVGSVQQVPSCPDSSALGVLGVRSPGEALPPTSPSSTTSPRPPAPP